MPITHDCVGFFLQVLKKRNCECALWRWCRVREPLRNQDWKWITISMLRETRCITFACPRKVANHFWLLHDSHKVMENLQVLISMGDYPMKRLAGVKRNEIKAFEWHSFSANHSAIIYRAVRNATMRFRTISMLLCFSLHLKNHYHAWTMRIFSNPVSWVYVAAHKPTNPTFYIRLDPLLFPLHKLLLGQRVA